MQRKILIIVSISILVILLSFLWYTYYPDSQGISLHRDPIIYTLDFSTKTINTYTPNQYLDFDPIVVSIQLTWVESQNVKWVTILERPANDITRTFESRHKAWFVDSGYYFTIPNITAEYLFDVKIEYYDWHTINSSDYFSGPILTIRPTGHGDQGIITLKTNKTHVSVWEQVSFEVVSKAQFNNEEYQKNQSILWDFDGDEIDDVWTIDKNQTHTYTHTWTYKPKVSVIYNWHSSIAYGTYIYVK